MKNITIQIGPKMTHWLEKWNEAVSDFDVSDAALVKTLMMTAARKIAKESDKHLPQLPKSSTE